MHLIQRAQVPATLESIAEGDPMVKVKQSKRIVGAQALADEIGITRFHLYKVVNGIRHPSQRVKAELDLRGIKCKPCRLPTNV